jgi:hypothetical protein
MFAGRIEVHRVTPQNRRWPWVWENAPFQGPAVEIGTGRGRRCAAFEEFAEGAGTFTLWEITGHMESSVLRLRGVPLLLASGGIASGSGDLNHSANPQFRGDIRWNSVL